MKALVLAGGSIKGAYSAGAQQWLFESGWIPERMYGISVGALLAGYNATLRGQDLDWTEIGDETVRLWREEVTSPQKILTARSPVSLGWDLIRGRWNGLYDTTPLKRLIAKWIDPAAARISDVPVSIGAVDLLSGQLEYQSFGDEPQLNLREWIRASAAEPILMPAVADRWVDGGLRDIAPLRQAIHDGATEIVVIATSPEVLPPLASPKRDLFGLAGRVLEILLNEALNTDLARAELINHHCSVAAMARVEVDQYRHVRLDVIRPANPLNLGITRFTSADIEALIQRGRIDAAVALS